MQDLTRKQLAGLFFDLLQREKMEKFGTHLQQLMTATENFRSLEQEVRAKESELQKKLESLSLPDHKFYRKVQEALMLEFPVFVRSIGELEQLFAHSGFDEPVDLSELPVWNRTMRTYKNSQTGEFIAFSRSLLREDGSFNLRTEFRERDIWRGRHFPKEPS